ncbi:hypothetical protein HBA54_27445 [Pelagibius litoralis]|uniref:Uncharacterized protein n=1 Tax=Pelagibius litoralis TaxID=374515 RepID=A0A967KGN0_9PROT|nr:hypothetical protein [Pelagibius litoralis]NIA72330.1 hypothetical protein [Pelagibius litoralis]
MIPALLDQLGALPGMFHRGGDAATSQGRQAFLENNAATGRDPIRLSPEAQAVDDTESVGEGAAAETESKALLGEAGGFVRKALETMRRDLGQVLKAFGFDADAVQDFTKAFVEPVLAALKEGVNFTAELSFAAFSQVTAISGSSFSQSTSMVAKSLEIAVNQDTGEVSVTMASVSFEQQIDVNGGVSTGATPLLVIDPETLGDPKALAEKILEGGEQPVVGGPGADTPAPGAASEGDEVGGDDETDAVPAALKEKLAELREKLAEDAIDFQTRLTIYSVSSYKNENGETITKLLLDAQIRITALAADTTDDASVQEEAQSLDLQA